MTRRLRTYEAVIASVVAIVGVANIPVTTRQGVNFEVTAHRLPLYLKSLEFIDRSAQYRQIAREITEGASTDRDRVLRVFDWTEQQIKATPDGWTIIDDHILNIIIRGHGTSDQRADVFATLATYAGVPAFWSRVPPGLGHPAVLLTFARVDGRWRAFDVANAVVFRTASGDLAGLEDLAGHPDLVPASVGGVEIDGAHYADIVAHASMPPVPHLLRARLQMPMPRLWHEMKAAAGLEPHDES